MIASLLRNLDCFAYNYSSSSVCKIAEVSRLRKRSTSSELQVRNSIEGMKIFCALALSFGKNL